MTLTKGITFDEFIILREKDYPNASGNLSKLLRDIGLAAKVINREVNKAGLVDILGRADSTNIHDEDQQKLDVFANDILIKYLSVGGQCCCVASEEMDDILPVDSEAGRAADYVVVFDPLDGSSNIDINASIGTIFTIFRRRSECGTVATEADVLQAGRDVVAAGYVIYGSSTMLVYSAGNGVNGFTLDPSIGEFCLSHPDIETPHDRAVLLGQPRQDRVVRSDRPGLHRAVGGRGAGAALHRLDGGRRAPNPAQGRGLPLPGERSGQGQAAPALRMHPHGLPHGAGRRPRHHRH